MIMKSIILIGPMGAGKTAIGRQLARRLSLPFFDTDEVVQQRTGVDIPLIFELEGEAGFRRREEAVVSDLVAGEPAVIATGGGVVVSAGNRAKMREGGFVVFLETSVEWQLSRTRRGHHRPLLATDDPRARLEEIYRTREALYRQCAHLAVLTDGRRVSTVAGDLEAKLRTTGIMAGTNQ